MRARNVRRSFATPPRPRGTRSALHLPLILPRQVSPLDQHSVLAGTPRLLGPSSRRSSGSSLHRQEDLVTPCGHGRRRSPEVEGHGRFGAAQRQAHEPTLVAVQHPEVGGGQRESGCPGRNPPLGGLRIIKNKHMEEGGGG